MTIPGGFVAGTVLPASDMNLLPAGVESGGYVQVTANQTGITTTIDLTGLTLTFPGVAGRRYRLQTEMNVVSSVGGDLCTVSITNGSNTVQVARNFHLPSTGVTSVFVGASIVVAPGAGSVTYKVRLERISGTGSLQMSASASVPAFLLIEDIGQT